MKKPKTRNKSEKQALFVTGVTVTGGTPGSITVNKPPPLDQYYVGSVCAAHPTTGHLPLYDKHNKPMTIFRQSSEINLRSRVCMDCGCVYFEIGQDL